LSVTSFIAIVSKARAHILRLTSARLQDLVASDWAARAVLRYWRLRNRARATLRVVGQHRRRLSVNLVGHSLVLGLGFLLVVPVMNGRSAPTRAIAAQYSGYVTWTGAARARTAVEMREAFQLGLKLNATSAAPPPISLSTDFDSYPYAVAEIL